MKGRPISSCYAPRVEVASTAEKYNVTNPNNLTQ